MRNGDFRAIWDAAVAAGRAAGDAAVPNPMVVGYNDANGNYRRDVIADGPCGFAWVQMAGNTAFAKWGKQNRYLSKAYPKGVWYWVGDYNQSMARKEAFAYAMAKSLRANGIDCSVGSRMD